MRPRTCCTSTTTGYVGALCVLITPAAGEKIDASNSEEDAKKEGGGELGMPWRCTKERWHLETPKLATFSKGGGGQWPEFPIDESRVGHEEEARPWQGGSVRHPRQP